MSECYVDFTSKVDFPNPELCQAFPPGGQGESNSEVAVFQINFFHTTLTKSPATLARWSGVRQPATLFSNHQKNHFLWWEDTSPSFHKGNEGNLSLVPLASATLIQSRCPNHSIPRGYHKSNELQADTWKRPLMPYWPFPIVHQIEADCHNKHWVIHCCPGHSWLLIDTLLDHKIYERSISDLRNFNQKHKKGSLASAFHNQKFC